MRCSFCVAALALAACSSSGSDAPPPPPAPDSVVFDVQWKPSTIVLGSADVDGSLASPAPNLGILHFAHATPAVKAITSGAYVVVPGAGLFHVTSVTPTADVDLGTEPASLLDAAESGHVAWDIGAHAVGKGPAAVLAPSSLRLLDTAPTPANFSGTIGAYNVTLALTPNGTRTNVAMTVEHVPFPGGALKIDVTGYIESFRALGEYRFSGGSTQAFTYGVRGYHADLTATYRFAAIQGTQDLTIPLSMVWPFLAGPIPMYVSLGMNLGMQSTLNASGDAGSGTAHFTYTGDFGATQSGASFQGTGGLGNVTFDLANAEHASNVTSGVEALLEAPKITIGVGVPAASSAFGANLFFKVKSEVVSNLTIPDPFATGKPSCLTVSCGAGVYYGGSLTLFGAQIAQESTISAGNKVLAKSGSACQ